MRIGRYLCWLLAIVPLTAAIPGPPSVDNGAVPRDGTGNVTLEHLWRLVTGDSILIGEVSDAVRDPATGRIYVLSMGQSTVHVLDADGTYRGHIGRAGQGPGELRFPVSLVWRSDGRLGVILPFPGKIVHLRPDGTPAGTLVLGEPGSRPWTLHNACDRGETLAVSATLSSIRERTWYIDNRIVAVDTLGRPLATFFRRQSTVRMDRPCFVERNQYSAPWDVAPDGAVVLAPRRDDYLLEIRAPDGTLRRTIHRTWRPRPRSAAEMAAIEPNIYISTNGEQQELERQVERFDAAVRSIRVRDDGWITVLDSWGRALRRQGLLGAWDLFDTAGVYRRRETVAVDPPLDDETDDVHQLDTDHWLLVREDPESPLGELVLDLYRRPRTP